MLSLLNKTCIAIAILLRMKIKQDHACTDRRTDRQTDIIIAIAYAALHCVASKKLQCESDVIMTICHPVSRCRRIFIPKYGFESRVH